MPKIIKKGKAFSKNDTKIIKEDFIKIKDEEKIVINVLERR